MNLTLQVARLILLSLSTDSDSTEFDSERALITIVMVLISNVTMLVSTLMNFILSALPTVWFPFDSDDFDSRSLSGFLIPV